jgi:hypothetical protein
MSEVIGSDLIMHAFKMHSIAILVYVFYSLTSKHVCNNLKIMPKNLSRLRRNFCVTPGQEAQKTWPMQSLINMGQHIQPTTALTATLSHHSTVPCFQNMFPRDHVQLILTAFHMVDNKNLAVPR